MAFLPGHDELIEEGYFTSDQLKWIAAYQYILMVLTLAMIVWLAINAWKILIKQKKWNVLPLLIFYILAFLLLVIDSVKLILSFHWLMNQNVVFFLYGQTLKFLIGVEQVWINLELIFSIKYSIDAMNKA